VSERTCGNCLRSESETAIGAGRKNCEECLAKMRKWRTDWIARNEDYGTKRTRKYREEYPHMTFYTTSRYQANKAGVFSDLTPEDAFDIYKMLNICAYCGKDYGENPPKRSVHIDHIIPMVQGGPNSRWNLTKVCSGCNSSKGSASLLDFYGRSGEFTEDRYGRVVAKMVELSGKSAELIAEFLTQSHVFELAYQEQRSKLSALVCA
jgi:5-methylcytosine-specific restriction endonuclease McrA